MISRIGEEVRELKMLCIFSGNIRWFNHFGKQFRESHKGIQTPYYSAILRKRKMYVFEKTCIQMIIATELET